MRQFRLVLNEALASALAQRTGSLLTIALCAAMVIAVMMTTGRAVGAEQSVLASIDAAGTRTVTIRSQASPAIIVADLERISGLDGVEWLAGFSRAYDSVNAHVPEGQRVAMRYIFSDQQEQIGITPSPSQEFDTAFASTAARAVLGMESVGPIARVDGPEYDIVGEIETPDFLQEFEPLILVAGESAQADEPITTLKFVVADVSLVRPVTTVVVELLAVNDPESLKIETSAGLAEISKVVGQQINDFNRELVAQICGVTAALLSVVLYGLVMMRRKDFGRRRALGASRGLVVSLLVLQTGILAIVGVLFGTVASSVALVALQAPLPSASFTLALCILAVAAALVASTIPALAASRRDPIKELRVP